MGIIFRNGIPFGAAEDDVTTVYAYEDLFDLTDKKENHLYIVEETSLPYRYDVETEQFYPLGADVPPITSERDEIIVGNGSNWAKGNGHKYYVIYSNGNQENIVGSLLDMPVAFGGLAAPIAGQTAPTLKNGYKAQGNAIADISGDARLYMGETSRLAIHDNAWLDVTGNDTQVKFNSGSKFFVDSLYGKNNMYMHGGFVVINDAKEPSHSKPTFYYYVLKSEYPDKPEADLQFFDENGVISHKYKDFSAAYPYKTEEEAIIDGSTVKGSDLTSIGYTYTLSSVYSWSVYIDGKSTPVWRIEVNFEKYDSEHPDIHISGNQPYNYNVDQDWPSESVNVPRINITGAPHIKIQDYSVISMETGARLDLNRQCQLVASQSFTSLYGSYLMMQSNQNSKFAPYIMVNDTESASQHQISLGFTTRNPESTSIPEPPIMSGMLSTPPENHCDISMNTVNLGPYKNYTIQKMEFSGRGYLASWLEGKLNNEYMYNYLPLVHYGSRVYIQVSVDGSSDYVVNPQVEYASRHVYAPDITGGSIFNIAPYLSSSSKFAAKFGGTNGAVTCIQYCPKGGHHSVLINPETSCDTYFKDEREAATNLAVHIKSKAGSNLLFTIAGGMGIGGIYNGTCIGYSGRPGTIQKMIEGIDTFELESGSIHKEMRDDSRFIMRGANYPGFNSPGVSYQNDSSQFYMSDTFMDRYRFAQDKCHLNRYWDRPINNEGLTSPTFQMYESSNLILRGWWNYPLYTNVKIKTTAYSYLQDTQVISLEEFKSHTTEWEEFLTYFSDNDVEFIGLVPESKIFATPTEIIVSQARVQYIGDTSYVKKYHPNAGLDTFGKRSSLLEITDNSELRMWDGICIYARYNPETNEPGIEIVNRFDTNGTDMDETGAKTPREKVTFTFNELRLLKRLIENFSPSIDELVSTNQESGLVNNIGLTGIMEEVEE